MIPVTLDKHTYADCIQRYMLRRSAHGFISVLLFIMIIFVLINSMFFAGGTPISAMVLWCIMFACYTLLLPNVILRRAESIYDNTDFLHDNMAFTFSTDNITWTTTAGERAFPLSSIQNISCIPDALIISFSNYQVMPIPYSQISPEQWRRITESLKASFPKADYTLYTKFKDAQ